MTLSMQIHLRPVPFIAPFIVLANRSTLSGTIIRFLHLGESLVTFEAFTEGGIWLEVGGCLAVESKEGYVLC
ncbi:hypothetical protein RJT34_13692 [Clitoria ternatea]|uniref:Uncharacterized protein n=1 Tax=Clitoria ternatea TaxID=43366 RepID=A0AAN9PLP6_CLITE